MFSTKVLLKHVLESTYGFFSQRNWTHLQLKKWYLGSVHEGKESLNLLNHISWILFKKARKHLNTKFVMKTLLEHVLSNMGFVHEREWSFKCNICNENFSENVLRDTFWLCSWRKRTVWNTYFSNWHRKSNFKWPNLLFFHESSNKQS